MPNNKKGFVKKVIYYEHDDRVPMSSDSTRRVSFKNYRNNAHKNVRQRARDEKMRVALSIQEDDVDMMIGNTSFSHHRGGFYGFQRGLGRRGRGGMRRGSPNPMKRLTESPVQWYKVMIPEGHKYESDYLLGLLSSYIKPHILTPFAVKKQNDTLQFYVDDYKAAQQLLLADRKIITSDHWRLVIFVRANIPQVEIDDGTRALMKLAMSSRYNVGNRALDLSKFHADPVIMKENAFCPLNRANVLSAIIQIIGDSIPDLLALNLSDNKLVAIDVLKALKTKTPSLKILHISRNNIRFIDQFDCLQGLQIEELELDGNPLCDKFREKEAYIRDVQKRFPKVVKLDGTDIPRCITFAVEEDTPLPPSKGSFLCDQAASNVISPFLQQYYSIYDSDSRAPLLDAYHLDAQFSLACSHQNSAAVNLSPYLQGSRNLLVVNNPDKRKKLLKKGRANILEYLTSLPKTQHDPTSLAVDCPVFSPSIIMFSVTGVFREVGDKKYPMRSFHRSFVIVPVGTGFCIVNELLHISLATSDQVKAAFVTPQPVEAVAPATVVLPPTPSAVPGAGAETDLVTKQQMVTTLAAQSGMNLSWSEKCLCENGWDFNRSVFVFTELNKTGKIPPDAFIK